MAGTYNVGDDYQETYPDAPRPPLKRHKVGHQLSIFANGSLAAIWEVTETDENEAKGKIIKVFKQKIPMGGTPTDAPQADPRKTKPAGNRKVKPL